ncbi:hypothetical protein [Oceanobacillus kapialis]|uniref:hypothetical protein n=1 Tax=Oceanobacillus kapialis TaxID=481353 RepID=UPI00384DFCA4
MTKKRLWSVGIGVGIVLVFALIYWFYLAKPTSFPSNEYLIEELNSVFPAVNASKIQDTIQMNGRNVLVPYISEDDDYGLSYWVWKGHKWRVANVDTAGAPMLWKLDKNDPSTYKIVWNLHPDDKVRSNNFYLMKERGYHIMEGVEEHYDPGVQMKKEVTTGEKSYGMIELPKEWVAFINSYSELGAAKQPNSFFKSFSPDLHLYFGWIPYDQTGKGASLDHSLNGSGFSNGNVEIDFIHILDEADLDRSK